LAERFGRNAVERWGIGFAANLDDDLSNGTVLSVRGVACPLAWLAFQLERRVRDAQ
jgi:hypothetical protein